MSKKAKRDYIPNHDKVIMIGKGHGWFDAPKNTEGFDVWGINDLIMQQTNLDLLFNMHRLEEYSEFDMASARFAGKLDIPIMMIEEYKEIPSSIEFPIKECLKEFDTDYISTAIPYMFAYAIMKGYKQIDCYGINMRGDDEKYKNARASVEYWIGLAKGRGVKVNMKGKYCDCLKAFDRRLYGYNELQTIPDDINDRALYVSFISGLDRTAMDKFQAILNLQEKSKYHDNLRPIPLTNDPNKLTLFGNLEEIIVKQGDGVKFVGDVGYYNLLHVDTLINSEHSSKIIIFKNDDKEVIKKDWLEFFKSKEANPLTKPDCEHWNGDKASGYDAFFPKYELPKEKAFDKFYQDYYMMALRSEIKFPGFIKLVNSNILDTIEGQKELLKFIGYTDDEMIINKEEVCPTNSSEQLTEQKTVK